MYFILLASAIVLLSCFAFAVPREPGIQPEENVRPSPQSMLVSMVEGGAKRLNEETNALDAEWCRQGQGPMPIPESASQHARRLAGWLDQLSRCIDAQTANQTLDTASRRELARGRAALERWIAVARPISRLNE